MAVSTNTFSLEENGVYESRPVAEACLRHHGGKHGQSHLAACAEKIVNPTEISVKKRSAKRHLSK